MSSSYILHKENSSSSSSGTEENPPPPKKKGRGSRTTKKKMPVNAEDSCIASRLRSSTPQESGHRSPKKRRSSVAAKGATFEFEIPHQRRSVTLSPLRDKNSRTADGQNRVQNCPSIARKIVRIPQEKILPVVTTPELPTNEDDDFTLPDFGLLNPSSSVTLAPAAPRCLLNAAEILREREQYETVQGKLDETDSEDDDEFFSPANTSAISSDVLPSLFEEHGEEMEMKFAQLAITRLDPLQVFTVPVRKAASPDDTVKIPENLFEHAFNQMALGNLQLPQNMAAIFRGYSPNFSQIVAMFHTFGADFTASFSFLNEREKSEATEYANSYLRFSQSAEPLLPDALGRLFELQSVADLPPPEKVPIFARVLMDVALDAQVISVESLRIHIGDLLGRCAQTVPVPPRSFPDWLPMHFVAHLASTGLKFPAVWRPEFSASALHLLLPGENFANFDEFLPIFVRQAKREVTVCPEKFYACLHVIRLGLNEEILMSRRAELRQLHAVLTEMQKSIRDDKQYQLARLKVLIKRILVLIADDQQQAQDFFGGLSLLAPEVEMASVMESRPEQAESHVKVEPVDD